MWMQECFKKGMLIDYDSRKAKSLYANKARKGGGSKAGEFNAKQRMV